MFSDGLVIGQGMMYAAAQHLLKFSKNKHVCVPDPRDAAFVLKSDANLKKYVNGEYDFELQWLQEVEKGNVVFIMHMMEHRWTCSVLWIGPGNDHFVRVYLCAERFKNKEIRVAKRIIKLCHVMAPELPIVKWTLHPAHDVVYEPITRRRSGVIMLARLWQLCQSAGLNAYLNNEDVETVSRHVQWKLLNKSLGSAKPKRTVLDKLGSPETRMHNRIDNNNLSASARSKRARPINTRSKNDGKNDGTK